MTGRFPDVQDVRDQVQTAKALLEWQRTSATEWVELWGERHGVDKETVREMLDCLGLI